MNTILTYQGNPFCTAHFQGKCAINYLGVRRTFEAQPIVCPPEITIVTATNKPDSSMLVRQLNNNNLSFLNEVRTGSDWNSNLRKIPYIIAALQKVTTPYVLITDAADVLLTADFANIVSKFQEFFPSKKMLYNAGKVNFPNVLIDKVSDRDYRGEFRYLNAGVCIADTSFALRFYSECQAAVMQQKISNPRKSEQLIVRFIFDKHQEDVDFDWECRLFQTFNHTTVIETTPKPEEGVSIENHLFKVF